MRKKLFLTGILLLATLKVNGQISLTPFIGVHSAKAKYLSLYNHGGYYGFIGVEAEKHFVPKELSLLHFSFVSGLSYLPNGFRKESGIAVSNFLYTEGISDLNTKYLQVPLVGRLNWQPFPLIEYWQLFFGMGVSFDFLLSSELAEYETTVFLSTRTPPAPPVTTHYEDSGDISQYGNPMSVFLRFEIGMKYKRIHLATRLSYSKSDMHHAGLENTWAVPPESSDYMFPYIENGKRKEKYVEFVLGWIFNGNNR